jgi:exosortase/archaeosortase family protein
MARRDLKQLIGILFRYLFLLILAFFLSFSSKIYGFLLAITIYPSSFIINLFYASSIQDNLILLGSKTIELIPACIGLSAYFLLLILTFTTPMKICKRIRLLLFLFLSFLAINILRITVLSILFFNSLSYFNILHKFIWYFLNIIIVVGIWFLGTYTLKIKEIPVYDDFKIFIKNLKR